MTDPNPMTAPPVDAQRLRALLEAASEGPWEVDRESGQLGSVYAPAGMVAQSQAALGDRHHEQREANAALIAAAVNALPALLAVWEVVQNAEIVTADSDACIRHLVLPFTEAGKQFRLVPSEAK